LVKYPEALRALRRLVKERGTEYIYPSPLPNFPATCLYVTPAPNLAPSCGLGKVFAEQFNVPVDYLMAADQGKDILGQVLRAGVELTEKSEALLFAFQRLQDRKLTYGTALEQAIEETASNPFPLIDDRPTVVNGREEILKESRS